MTDHDPSAVSAASTPRLVWTDSDGDTWSEPLPTAEALAEVVGNHYGTWRAEDQEWTDVAAVVLGLLVKEQDHDG